MQIRLISKGLVELSDNGNIVMVGFPEAKIPEGDIRVFGPHIQKGVISRPGEYEFKQSGLVALETKEMHIGVAELYNVEFSGIDVLFVMSDFGTLNKDDWDELDSVDVVVVSLANKPDGLEKLINRMLPYVVLAIDAESESEAEKLLGMKPLSKNDKFKFTDKDFEAEDPATVLHLMQ